MAKKGRNAVHKTSEWLGLMNAKNTDPSNNIRHDNNSQIASFDSHNHQDNFTTWTEGQPDNWNVRILCGPKCKSQPKFQITRQLFEYTLHRLAMFRHVLFVEDIRDSYNQMASTYQWKLLHKDYMRKPTRQGNYDRSKVSTFQWNPHMSVLDDALYEFAKRKYNQDNNQSDLPNMRNDFANQAQVDQYFALGPLQNCTNVCCGPCTQY